MKRLHTCPEIEKKALSTFSFLKCYFLENSLERWRFQKTLSPPLTLCLKPAVTPIPAENRMFPFFFPTAPHPNRQINRFEAEALEPSPITSSSIRSIQSPSQRTHIIGREIPKGCGRKSRSPPRKLWICPSSHVNMLETHLFPLSAPSLSRGATEHVGLRRRLRPLSDSTLVKTFASSLPWV